MSTTPSAGAPGTPQDEEPKRSHRGAKATAWTVGGLAVLAAAVWVGGALFTQDRLPAHLTVDGVDVSGQSADQAMDTLNSAFAEQAKTQLKLTAGERSVAVTPADAGLGVDADATLSDLTGLSWNPATIWGRLMGSQDVAAERTVDDSALEKTVQAAAKDLDTDATEGKVLFDNGTVDYTAPADGSAVDVKKTAAALKKQWLHADGSVAAVTTTSKPKISADTWSEFVDSTAKPLVSDPVTLKAGSEKATLTVAQLGDAASVDTDSGKPELSLDGDALVKDAVKANSALGSSGRDATVKLVGKGASAKPEIVPAKTGKGLEAKDVAAAVTKAATGSDRTASVTLKEAAPSVTTAQAKKWDLTEVAHFETPYPYEPIRTKNLVVGSARVNGTVVMPGKEFNLANEFGPVTTANGYYKSGVVESGLSTEAVGGGLSQIATMSYNAGFLSGMDILEHKAHSRWFDRYPAGRESTYWEGQINVRWRNNTNAPVIVQMWVADNHVHMKVWGKKTWTVKTTSSDHYNITNPQTIHSSGSQCVPENSGIKGFTITVTRQRSSSSKTLPAEKFVTTYGAWPHVICDKK